MKKLIVLATLGVSLAGLSACSLGNSTIVETKNGNIDQKEFYNKLVATSGPTVLEQMIEEKVLKENYSVTDKEVAAELKKVKAQFSSDSEYKSALKSSGIKDEAALKDQIELSLIQKKAVTEGVDATDKKLEAYYKKHKEDYETAKGMHILVADKKTATEVKKKLDNGEDFAKVAKEFSTDTATAQNGGDIGEFKRSDMVDAFSDAAFSIKLNTISEPVQTDYGYHIIKITERKQKTFKEAKSEVKDAYLQENQKSYQSVIKKLKTKEKVDIKDKDLESSIKTLLSSATNTASTSTTAE